MKKEDLQHESDKEDCEESDEDEELEERFKGMTAYQIRQILKKEKEEQRVKRK